MDSLLDAAARILVRDGISKFTTNHVAAEANVSVGSLYQYFPNKGAILIALMQKMLEEAQAARPPILDTGSDLALNERIDAVVTWHLDVRRRQPDLHERINELRHMILSPDQVAGFDAFHQAAVLAGLAHHRDEIAHDDMNLAAHVVSRFLDATTRSATAEKRELLNDKSYERAVAQMITTFLTTPPEPG